MVAVSSFINRDVIRTVVEIDIRTVIPRNIAARHRDEALVELGGVLVATTHQQAQQFAGVQGRLQP